MKRNTNCNCAICTKPIYRRPSQIKSGNVYCSLRCTGKSQQKENKCKVCDKTYIGAKATCSRACANISRTGIIYTREGKFDKAYRGTLLKEKIAIKRGGICERCNMDNYAILQVHHKKERHKGGSDRITNLELLCPNCHTTHHLGKNLFNREKNARVHRTKNK